MPTQHKYIERLTATEVLSKVITERICVVQIDKNGKVDYKDYQAALRSTQRFLSFVEFQRGKRTGSLKINPDHIIRRSQHLQALLSTRSQPIGLRLNEVYADESYIHQKHRTDKDNLYHSPNEREENASHRSKRYFLAVAIDYNLNTCSPKLVPKSYWDFTPSDKNSHKGDYHIVFDSNTNYNWFESFLFPNVSSSSVIILDNAKYHHKKSGTAPEVSKMKKKDVLEEIERIILTIIFGALAIEDKLILQK